MPKGVQWKFVSLTLIPSPWRQLHYRGLDMCRVCMSQCPTQAHTPCLFLHQRRPIIHDPLRVPFFSLIELRDDFCRYTDFEPSLSRKSWVNTPSLFYSSTTSGLKKTPCQPFLGFSACPRAHGLPSPLVCLGCHDHYHTLSGLGAVPLWASQSRFE